MKLKSSIFALSALAVALSANAGTATIGSSSLTGVTDGFTYTGSNATGFNGVSITTTGSFPVFGQAVDPSTSFDGFWFLDQVNNSRTQTFTFTGSGGATAFSATWYFSPLLEDEPGTRGNLDVSLMDVDGNNITCSPCAFTPGLPAPLNTYASFFSVTSDVAIRSFTLTAADGLETYAMNGLKYVPAASPVPEPETYAMMLAGLGALGFMARRRRIG